MKSNITKGRTGWFAPCVVLALALTACGGGNVSPAPLDPRLSTVLDDLLLHALDPLAPGRGRPDYPDVAQADIPKADAMVLKAGLMRGATPDLVAMASRSLQRLQDSADADGDGVVGWGLPFAWDAFGDGTTNPGGTVYAISTAIVIDALLDQGALQGGAPRDALARQSLAALQPFMDPTRKTPGGLPPYSLTPQDRSWDVFNTAVYLAAMAQRLSLEPALAAQAASLRDWADQVMEVMAQRHLTSADGAWYWPYLLPGSSVNDLPHAGYMIYGVETYIRNGGRRESAFDRPALWRHLREFLVDGEAWVRAYPNFLPSGPARLYDIGFVLLTLCQLPNEETAVRDAVLNHMPQYRLASGHYAKYPVGLPVAQPLPVEVITEYETYLLAGTAACRAAGR
ncbi:hypothetical protein BurJ1DRAFT_4129 [Burkholderiales bacterium JOSHI_001]|nr:hypothetical protein BurJ1DRAFT_4129 [Burkholderiales bacterium JOSHI_001]